MASRIATADGNWLTAATWGLVDATSLLDSEAGNTEIGTGYVASSNFTPGAITIDGIAVKLASRASAGAYTMSVQLYNATDVAAVAGTEVTINLTDLPTAGSSNKEGGWAFFKFASPVTLTAGKAYNVQAKESNAAADIYLFRDATANNWSRMLRTTTTGAPAATDIMHIMEEKTGAGAATARTVTMDCTANTDHGSGTNDTPCVTISKGGTLQFAYAAATNYYLKCSGDVIVYNGGTFTIGTVANPIPRNGTAVLEFDPASDGGMGLIVRNGGTFTAQGLSRTTAKNIVSTTLRTDEAAGQTELGIDGDTGWLNNDVVAIAPTAQTSSQYEHRTMNADQGAADHIHVSAGLTNAHSGTTPTKAEVILLTRNVKIRSASSTSMSYTYYGSTATVDIDWVQFYYVGTTTNSKYGWGIDTTSGSLSIMYSSLHDCDGFGFYIINSASDNITLSYNCIYRTMVNLSSSSSGNIIQATSAGGNIVVTYNIIIAPTIGGAGWGYNNYGVEVKDTGINFSNNTITGAQHGTPGGGLLIEESSFNIATGTFNNNTVHTCSAYGVVIQQKVNRITIDGLTIWRNAGVGLVFNNNNTGAYYTVQYGNYFKNVTLFGNQSGSISMTGYTPVLFDMTFENLISNGDSSFATTNGININSGSVIGVKFINCNFSTASGIKVAHTTDINLPTSGSVCLKMLFVNTKLGAATEFNSVLYLDKDSYIKIQKHDQTSGLNKTYFAYGLIQIDTTVFNTASPSEKMTPNNASNKLESGSFKVNVNSGQVCTPHVYVRQSKAAEGDSADYNGAKPRLILKRNDAIGISSDTVIDTAANGIGNPWEELTGNTAAASEDGVMEFIIDCNGTTGFINVDDFSATVA
jgi:hypothetical protein